MAQLREDMSFLDPEAYRPVAGEFEALRAAITTHVAQVAPEVSVTSRPLRFFWTSTSRDGRL
ncbi:hypothetical protein DF047_37160 [Burkholderia cenocepacia]|nr:hypothetical protein DF047_37160 [Burkholderia cenocepacia]